MRRCLHLLAGLIVLTLMTTGATAQSTTLVADQVSIEADRTLVAEGNVEVLSGTSRMTATRVVYDSEAGTLEIEGPIVLADGPDTVVLASSAELDENLKRGILESARLVLDRQLQISAQQMAMIRGEYTRLSRVLASSCNVCGNGKAPLWEIRAKRVVRDEKERQLYFDNAQLRVAGVPVFYLPRLRLPDPTLKRATGFLVPQFRNRSQLSTGVLLPYFIRMGDHQDLTLTPYISSKTTTLEYRYRRQFASGSISVNGAISRDDILPDEMRAYIFAQGRFNLRNDFRLSFDIEATSDNSYLFDYGYSEKDRLDSSVRLERTRDEQLFRFAATVYETLRARELRIEDELPNEILEFELQQRLFESANLGSVWVKLDSVALARASNADGRGRDVSRLGGAMTWQTSGAIGLGLVAEAKAELGFDAYRVAEDSRFKESLSRTHAGGSVTLRYPLQRVGGGGARHLLEPIAQIAWLETSGDAVPNEDSRTVEFDEANLTRLSRFPGADRREMGGRVNLGVAWTRHDPKGWSIGATAGRILRFESTRQFGSDTGLAGKSSDWLLALHYRLDTRLFVASRSLLDDDLDISRSETRFDWRSDKFALGGTHLWRAADPTESRFTNTSELALDGKVRIGDFWTADGEWRFDADDGETTRAGVGLTFENECIQVGLSLSRRFTSSSNVVPATEFDLRVALTGFGTGGEVRRVRRKCRG